MTAKIIDDPTYRERTFVFQDRFHAGNLLSEKLKKYAGQKKVIVLALPAGGVPVGAAVAKKLGTQIDVMVVRKIQIPWNTEAGFGAITWDGETVLDESLVEQLGLTKETIAESISKTRKSLQERITKFKGDKPLPSLKEKVVILMDDGLASGFTMLAAARSAKKRTPKKIVVAVPTASIGAIKLLAHEVDEIVCLNIRSGTTFAVADAYKHWYDLADEEVIRILKKDMKPKAAPKGELLPQKVVFSVNAKRALSELQSYSKELGLDLTKPEDRFKWFLASVLFAKRIRAETAKETYLYFEQEELTTPDAILQAGWERLVDVLDHGGYTRYDFSTATNLLGIAKILKEKYGSLERLHAESSSPSDLENRLQEIKGVGPVGVNIFLRELRGIWEKAKPNPSPMAVATAKKIGLCPEDVERYESQLVRLNLEYCKKHRSSECPLENSCSDK